METTLIVCPLCKSKEFKYKFKASLKLTFVECKKCSLIFSNPQPTKRALFNFYKPGVNRWIDQKGFYTIRIDYIKFYLKLIKRYSKSLQLKPSSVLDIGCGNGLLLEYFKNNLKLKTAGVELSPQDCAIAKKKADKIINASIENSNISSKFKEKFDIVIATDVFEHLPNPPKAMRNISKIAKKNSLLIIDTGDIGGFGASIGGALNPFTQDEGHITFFSRKTIQLLLNKYGFEIIKFHDNREVFPKEKLEISRIFFRLKRMFTSTPNMIVVAQKIK